MKKILVVILIVCTLFIASCTIQISDKNEKTTVVDLIGMESEIIVGSYKRVDAGYGNCRCVGRSKIIRTDQSKHIAVASEHEVRILAHQFLKRSLRIIHVRSVVSIYEFDLLAEDLRIKIVGKFDSCRFIFSILLVFPG